MFHAWAQIRRERELLMVSLGRVAVPFLTIMGKQSHMFSSKNRAVMMAEIIDVVVGDVCYGHLNNGGHWSWFYSYGGPRQNTDLGPSSITFIGMYHTMAWLTVGGP